MRPDALIDTGVIVALLDATDAWHLASRHAFAAVRPPLATSAAVLTEAFHLLGDRRADIAAGWRLIRSGAITVLPVADADLEHLDELMARYADHPMDFADATLVHLAGRESLTTILTIDNDDFETYRIDGRRGFRILPGRLKRRR